MKVTTFRNTLTGICLCSLACVPIFATAECSLTRELVFKHAEIGAVQVFRDANTKAVAFTSQMQVNTDGEPKNN